MPFLFNLFPLILLISICTSLRGQIKGHLSKDNLYSQKKSVSHRFASGSVTSIGNTINDYTSVIAYSSCTNGLITENATAFKTGDTVLIIQMKGAAIDITNTSNFGNITDYKGSGNYELNLVKRVVGNQVDLVYKLARSYEIPDGRVQLIRVPYYKTALVTSTLTCFPWDGNKGGVLVLNASDSIILNADIDVSNNGFRGGAFERLVSNCSAIDFFYDINSTAAALKGEGISELSNSIIRGRGKAANAGGSGSDHNSGGGGGSNYGYGGMGGKEFFVSGGICPVQTNNGGLGGTSLQLNNIQNKIFLGGGGGAGDVNGFFGGGKGGNGGGIVILIAPKIQSNGFNIFARGESAVSCPFGGDCWEGFSGGGAGGTVLLSTTQLIDNININTSGGDGGSTENSNPAGYNAPGGGAGGGVLWINSPVLPGNVNHISNGGIHGIFRLTNEAGGSTNGSNGGNVFNLKIPVASTLFKANIDSVRIAKNAISCTGFNFNGIGYTNTSPIASWQWFFGDGNSANTQSASNNYSVAGSYTIKLIATDINGCIDSTTLNITTSDLTVDAGPDIKTCLGIPVTLHSNVINGATYSWSPSQYLNDASLLTPIATPPITSKFYLTATSLLGCQKTDSVLVTVLPRSNFSVSPASSMCINDSVKLSASGGYLYSWSPNSSLSDATIDNPYANPITTTIYTVTITDTVCHESKDLSTTVTVNPLPSIKANKSNDIDCVTDNSHLNATGGTIYEWIPASTLDNPSSGNPIARPSITTKYTVTGTDGVGCKNKDTIVVVVSNNKIGGFQMPTAFTPNNDGLNDCFGVSGWGVVQEIDFSIYNRWGERVFHSKEPGRCWNGIFKGTLQDSGIFIYMISAKTNCNPSVFRKGTFMLIR